MNEMKIAIQREHQQQNGSSKKKNLWVRRQGVLYYLVRTKEKEWRKPAWSVGHHQKNNLWIIGVSEGEHNKQWAESYIKKIIAENLPHLGRNLDI